VSQQHLLRQHPGFRPADFRDRYDVTLESPVYDADTIAHLIFSPARHVPLPVRPIDLSPDPIDEALDDVSWQGSRDTSHTDHRHDRRPVEQIEPALMAATEPDEQHPGHDRVLPAGLSFPVSRWANPPALRWQECRDVQVSQDPVRPPLLLRGRLPDIPIQAGVHQANGG